MPRSSGIKFFHLILREMIYSIKAGHQRINRYRLKIVTRALHFMKMKFLIRVSLKALNPNSLSVIDCLSFQFKRLIFPYLRKSLLLSYLKRKKSEE